LESSPLYGSNRVNSLLEFLATVVNIWLKCDSSKLLFECILNLSNNTLEIGWLFTSSKFPANSLAHKAHLMVTWQLASLLLTNNHCLAYQHVADLLSFAGTDRRKAHPLAYDHPTDKILTQCFHQDLPHQIPADFTISPLPKNVLSWVAAVLQMHKSYLTANKKAPTRPMTPVGEAGSDSAMKPASLLTPSSLLYPSKKLTLLPRLSSCASEQLLGLKTEKLQELANKQWRRALTA
jgi:hypothetical protein